MAGIEDQQENCRMAQVNNLFHSNNRVSCCVFKTSTENSLKPYQLLYDQSY